MKNTHGRPLFDSAFSPDRLARPVSAISHEPFGFADGISQPALDWQRANGALASPNSSTAIRGARRIPARLSETSTASTPIGRCSVRPQSKSLLPPAAEDPAACDLGRNGTYLVLRDLQQDVAASGNISSAKPRPAARPAARRGDGRPHDGRGAAGCARRAAYRREHTE